MDQATNTINDNLTKSIECFNSSNHHLIELYQIPPFMIVLLTLFYLSVSLFAVVGNIMVLWVVIKSRRMHTITNLFIANLALADLVIGALVVPFQFQAALLQKWVLPYFLCSLCPTAQVVSLNVSIFTLVAISLDRRRAVYRPITARLFKTRAIITLVAIWVFSFILAIPTFIAWEVKLLWSEVTKNYTEPFCDYSSIPPHFWKTYNHILVALQYFIPLLIISCSYIHMARILKLSISRAARSNNSLKALEDKKRVITMLSIVVALFAICWLPFQLYNILQEIYPSINEFKYINVIWFSCHWLSMSNCCYNPLIYAIYGERFQIEFYKRFRICRFLFDCSGKGPPPDIQGGFGKLRLIKLSSIQKSNFSNVIS